MCCWGGGKGSDDSGVLARLGDLCFGNSRFSFFKSRCKHEVLADRLEPCNLLVD